MKVLVSILPLLFPFSLSCIVILEYIIHPIIIIIILFSLLHLPIVFHISNVIHLILIVSDITPVFFMYVVICYWL